MQAAADNIDLNEETLNGKTTTHATSMVLYQRKQVSPLPGTFPESPRMYKRTRQRSISTTVLPSSLRVFSNVGPKRNCDLSSDSVPGPYFNEICQDLAYAKSLDAAWILYHFCPKKLFTITLDSKCNQTVQGWTGFNAAVSSVDPASTSIGYCQLLPESPTQYNTVYTVMKTVQQLTYKLGQRTPVITFDEAIYCKAKEI